MKTTKLIPTFAMFLLVMSSVFAFTVSGIVTDDATGAPISGANVQMINSITSAVLDTDTTLADGLYSVDSVGSGLRTITASKAGYITQNPTRWIAVDTTINFDLGPTTTYTLSGTEGNSLNGVTVRLKNSLGSTIDQTITAGGAYSFTVVAGTYTIEASYPTYNVHTSTPIVVSANTIYPFTLVHSVTTGTVSGYVRDSSNAIINGATVRLKLSGATVQSTTNTPAGYSITYNQGTYDLTASMTGYNDQTRTVTITAGQTTSINFTLPAAGITCPQAATYGSWSSCTGTQTRTITYYNYSNTCGWTYTATESQGCSTGDGSSGGSSSGKKSTSSSDAIIPTIKTFDATVQNPAKYSMNGFDSLVFTYKDVKYTMKLIQIQPGKVTLSLSPANQQVTGETGNVLAFNLNENDTLQVTILDMTYDQASSQYSTVSLNVYLNAKKEETVVQKVVQQVVEKVKDAVVNVVGVVAQKEPASLAVGATISASIVVIGLIIFFVVRRIARPKF